MIELAARIKKVDLEKAIPLGQQFDALFRIFVEYANNVFPVQQYTGDKSFKNEAWHKARLIMSPSFPNGYILHDALDEKDGKKVRLTVAIPETYAKKRPADISIVTKKLLWNGTRWEPAPEV